MKQAHSQVDSQLFLSQKHQTMFDNEMEFCHKTPQLCVVDISQEEMPADEIGDERGENVLARCSLDLPLTAHCSWCVVIWESTDDTVPVICEFV